MGGSIELLIPAFTDHNHWKGLDIVLQDVRKDDVVIMELYHELKEITLEYLNGTLSTSYKLSVTQIISQQDPELIEQRPCITINPTHFHIINSLKNRSFKSFETLEDYCFGAPVEERNKRIIPKIASLIRQHGPGRYIVLMAAGHSMPLLQNLNDLDSPCCLNSQGFNLEVIDKVREDQYFSYVLSGHLCSQQYVERTLA